MKKYFLLLIMLMLVSGCKTPRMSSLVRNIALSEDPGYGYSMENPIRIGYYDQERSEYFAGYYIAYLRSSDDQPLRIARKLSMLDAKGNTIECYKLMSEGRPDTISLYFDLGHTGDIRIPKGLKSTALPYGIYYGESGRYRPLEVYVTIHRDKAIAQYFYPLRQNTGFVYGRINFTIELLHDTLQAFTLKDTLYKGKKSILYLKKGELTVEARRDTAAEKHKGITLSFKPEREQSLREENNRSFLYGNMIALEAITFPTVKDHDKAVERYLGKHKKYNVDQIITSLDNADFIKQYEKIREKIIDEIISNDDPSLRLPKLRNDTTFALEGHSADTSYGFTPANPVKVGGFKWLRGEKNMHRFLNALAGPNGEKLQYRFSGSCCPLKTTNFLQNKEHEVQLRSYTLEWSGGQKTLYINEFDYEPFRCPAGLTIK